METVRVSAQVEAELIELGDEERADYLEGLGVSEGGLQSLIQATYKLLGLRTYFPTGEKETRAWTFKAGMTAPQAAGVIHTDFERGFIRAQTMVARSCWRLALSMRPSPKVSCAVRARITSSLKVMSWSFSSTSRAQLATPLSCGTPSNITCEGSIRWPTRIQRP